jgi:glycopeptide antibiotics resistance protein
MKDGLKKHIMNPDIVIAAAILLFSLALAYTPRTLIEFYYNGAFVHMLRIVKTFVFVAVPLVLAAYLFYKSSIDERAKRVCLNIIWYFSFALYIAVLFFILFGGGRRDYDYSGLKPNLLPFISIVKAIKAVGAAHELSGLIGILLNILLFVPFGFLLPWKIKNEKLAMLCMFLFVCISEAAQQLFVVGVFDIDDIFLNLIGAGAGILIYRAILRIVICIQPTEARRSGKKYS